MKKNGFVPVVMGSVFILLSLLVAAGCGKKEPPLSPAAQAFKREMQEEIGRLAPLLAAPLAAGNARATEQAIEKGKSDMAGGSWKAVPLITALDRNGVVVVKDPSRKQAAAFDYSTFTAVQEALSKRKTTATRLYLADGSRIFIVGAPIAGKNGTAGVLVFAFTDDDITQKLGIAEKDFLAINFNR